MELNSCVCGMEIYFNFNSQETYDFQILENEALIITGYEHIKISICHQLVVKLRLKEDDDLHTNCP